MSVLFKEKKYEILSTFLFVEVNSFEEWVKEEFDKVLSGKSQYEEINGNVCSVKISFEITQIFDMLTEDDEEYYNSGCEVSTKELRLLIDEWCDKRSHIKK